MLQTRNINLDVKRIIGYRQFCNKIWNTFKFSKKALGTQHKPINYGKTSYLNTWILGKLNKAIKGMNDSLEKYEFGEATTYFYNFWYYELCDVFLEAIKPVFAGTN
jgi:valyl-tRNA synthetase